MLAIRNYTLTRVWGVPTRISISLVAFLPVLAWFTGSGSQTDVYAGIIGSVAPGRLDAGTDAFETLATPDEGGGVAIAERDGGPVRVISTEDFAAFLEIRSA